MSNSNPYRPAKAGDPILAETWNGVQDDMRNHVLSHTHTGGPDQGVKLTGASIDSASTLSVAKVVVSGALEATGGTTLGNTLTVSGKTNLNGGLAVAGADVTIGSPATNQNLSVFGLGVLKKLVVTDTGSVAFRHMRDGTLTIGNITESFGGATDNFASNNIAGLLLETKDNTEIAVHDSEHRVASLMYYEGGTSNRVTIGRNMGWGALGSLNVAAALNATGATTLSNTLTVSGMTNLNGGVTVAGGDVVIGTPELNQMLSVYGIGVFRKLVVTDAESAVAKHMASGSLTIGNTARNFGGATDEFKSNNIAGLLLETLDNTEIAVHDYGHRLASLMYYEGGTVNRVTIGRSMGWGTLSSLNVAAALNVTGATTAGDTLTVSGKTNLNGGLTVTGDALISGSNLTVRGGTGQGSRGATLSNSSLSFILVGQTAGALVYASGKGFELQDISNGFTRYDDLKLRNLEMTGILKVGSNGVVVCPETTRIIRGTVNANGTSSAGAGYTITKKAGSVGVYDINFNAAFGSPPSVVVTQIYPGNDIDTSGDTRDNAVVVSISNNKARIKTGDSTGTAADRQFTFIAIGP